MKIISLHVEVCSRIRDAVLHLTNWALCATSVACAAIVATIYLWLLYWLAVSDVCSAAFGILLVAVFFSYVAGVVTGKPKNRQRLIFILCIFILFLFEAFFVKQREANPLPRFLELKNHAVCYAVCKEKLKATFMMVDEGT